MSPVAALVAFPAAALVIWTLLRSDLARRLVAAPSGDRWHAEATPIFGGVGIYLGFVAGVGAALAIGAVEPGKQLLGVVGGCSILFAAGLLDDVVHLNPVAKLAAQFGAATVVLVTGTSVQIVHNPIVATAIALVWLVGMTNAFNLLDNMDGLASTLAAIAAGFFAIDAVTVHPSHQELVLALAIGLACAGFIPFNLRRGKPAAVFMGDSGSQVLGFALASLGLASSWKVAGTTVATLILPILVLAVPILDTGLVTVVRLLEGRPVYQGGRDHTSHRLVYHGLSEKKAVALLGLVAAMLGVTSLAYNVLDDARITLVGVLLTFGPARPVRELPRRHRAPALRRGDARALPHVRRPLAATGRGRRRLRARHGRVRCRVRAPLHRRGHDQPAAPLHRDAAGADRGALPRVHPVRPLPQRLALRRRARRRPDRARGRDQRGRDARLHRADAGVGRLLAQHLRDRRAALHRARGRVEVRPSAP